MTNARKICLLLSFFLYILNASAQEEIKKDTTAQNSKGVLVNLTDGIATTVRHTGRKIRKVGKEFNVTRERIRQIEAKALRKLRHPSRSKKLKDYLD